MHEQISTFVLGNEPITLLIAEPLDGSGFALTHFGASPFMLNLPEAQPVPALQENRPNLTSLGDPYVASGTELATFYTT
jgi:hypothetical protein